MRLATFITTVLLLDTTAYAWKPWVWKLTIYTMDGRRHTKKGIWGGWGQERCRSITLGSNALSAWLDGKNDKLVILYENKNCGSGRSWTIYDTGNRGGIETQLYDVAVRSFRVKDWDK
jgi:hypothetical protein